MKIRVPLYTVQLVEAGQTSGTPFSSFVYLEGAFRFAGPMDAVK